MAWLSFIELDVAVVRVIRLASLLWLWFQCVCPLIPSCNTYHLTWVSPTLDMGHLFSLPQQSVAAAPYLGWGVSPHGRTMQKGTSCDGQCTSMAERSYPRSEVGAVAEKSNPTSKEQLLWGCRRAESSYSTFKVRRHCHEKTKECWGEKKKVCPFLLIECSKPLSPWVPWTSYPLA